MKNKQKFDPFLRSFAILLILILITIAVAVSLFYYIFSIPEPEGLSLASWPQRFTDNFSVWMNYNGENINIDEIGLKRLDEYELWLQVINENGDEIFSYNKPENQPAEYSASKLMVLGSSYDNDYTVFTNSLSDSGNTFSYIIGFPYYIEKHILYYNGENIQRLMPTAKVIILSILIVLTVLFWGYTLWLSRKLSGITSGIQNILLRNYKPLPENGIFGEICKTLNKMYTEIKKSDRLTEETENKRREWLANITHDIKTPLSPIKGYAELLADGREFEYKDIQEYGNIILKNIYHTENLINDLKLTYQLDSGIIPYKPQDIPITRYIREIVIDIINDPAFSDRDTEFKSHASELLVSIDPELFRRAVQNIIINAFIHNPPDTKVKIIVDESPQGGALISIRDNGIGMKESELSELFDRYYRGTNTREKTEGSGLGLAIAKQIITLHGGDISVKSEPNAGSEFVIVL
ncbi:MAG: HAMP domain-containing histidine kinase [Firmicutes bacterium]|nr:HAMP domain-containing histidine kinase [Bacillota bacterium]